VEVERKAWFRVLSSALLVYGFAILAIGLTRDWRLIHEDNGAMHTTFALSHLRVGLAMTRAHDLLFNPTTGASSVYGHHPPATALIVAGAFALTGSDTPWVARMVAILFHMGTLALVIGLFTQFFTRGQALIGGFFMATLPMSSYFGRMVNYEPLCLFAVLIQLTGYISFKKNNSRTGLKWLCFGIFLGGMIDWAAFFFAAAIIMVETIDVLTRRSESIVPLVVILSCTSATFLLVLVHLWYAGHGSLTALRSVLLAHGPTGARELTATEFVFSQLQYFRRYFTHTGLLAAMVLLFCLLFPRNALSIRILDVREPGLVKRLLVITGAAALAYILAAPGWAKVHAYWQFYFLPFVVVSMLLCWRFLCRMVPKRLPLVGLLLQTSFLMDVTLSSAYMLYKRHTTAGCYAIRATASFRELYLAPSNHGDKGVTTPQGQNGLNCK